MSSKDNLKKYFYVYYSYEPWGRGYIGKRECWCKPEDDVNYFGSFTDKTFKPTQKVIIEQFNTQREAYEAEVTLHEYYQVDINPHFANKSRQKRKLKGQYNQYNTTLKIEDVYFKANFIEVVKTSFTIKEVLLKLGYSDGGPYKTIKKWIKALELDTSHFKSNVFYFHNENKTIEDSQLIEFVEKSKSIAEVLRMANLKISGSSYIKIKKRIKKLNISTSHFSGQGWNKGGTYRGYLTEEQKEKLFYKYMYAITTPSGEIIHTKNLKAFCREHNLRQGNMWSVCVGRSKKCKGYSVVRTPLNQLN